MYKVRGRRGERVCPQRRELNARDDELVSSEVAGVAGSHAAQKKSIRTYGNGTREGLSLIT